MAAAKAVKNAAFAMSGPQPVVFCVPFGIGRLKNVPIRTGCKSVRRVPNARETTTIPPHEQKRPVASYGGSIATELEGERKDVTKMACDHYMHV